LFAGNDICGAMNVYQCSSMAGVLSDCETGCECKEVIIMFKLKIAQQLNEI